jgi:DNA-binding helix-hairpin-helix protein with protein kinase domain
MQTRTPPRLFDSSGRPLQLGQQLGAGGEGAVFELRDRSDLVVKLYHKGLEPEKAAKIAHMAEASKRTAAEAYSMADRTNSRRFRWRAVVGFTMPKIRDHKQAFSLYSPKLRLQEFPNASWQFLIRSAANAARAFAVIHESGHVIGDVNHGNLFVGDRATVRLIDCDSYQITINGSRWFCEVGTVLMRLRCRCSPRRQVSA